MTLIYPKITEEKVRNLHSIGFKLIPILQDGFTPAITWTKVYENGWDEAEIFRTQFLNIATCFGKTHLKDEDNTELYLNCLDIDREEVLNRLAVLTDKNGKDVYFVVHLRKHTYVTQTRKKYGRHIYWLSHNPNKTIHKQECKHGHVFEIKTDKSGLARVNWYHDKP